MALSKAENMHPLNPCSRWVSYVIPIRCRMIHILYVPCFHSTPLTITIEDILFYNEEDIFNLRKLKFVGTSKTRGSGGILYVFAAGESSQ